MCLCNPIIATQQEARAFKGSPDDWVHITSLSHDSSCSLSLFHKHHTTELAAVVVEAQDSNFCEPGFVPWPFLRLTLCTGGVRLASSLVTVGRHHLCYQAW